MNSFVYQVKRPIKWFVVAAYICNEHKIIFLLCIQQWYFAEFIQIDVINILKVYSVLNQISKKKKISNFDNSVVIRLCIINANERYEQSFIF